MTLPSSGQISLSMINSEFGIGTNLSAYRGTVWYTDSGTSGTFPSTNISMNLFYGKRKNFPQFTFTSDSGATILYNQDVRTMAFNAGWNGSTKVVFNNYSKIGSQSTTSPALTITGSFPGGLVVNNYGMISGMGGSGGNGWSSGTPTSPTPFNGTPGSAGGTAIYCRTSCQLNNYGVIYGGGGGGGGGAGFFIPDDEVVGPLGAGGGGGGGGQGNFVDGVEWSSLALPTIVSGVSAWQYFGWGNFMNQGAVWYTTNSGTYGQIFDKSFNLYFPKSQNYTFYWAMDNAGYISIDGTDVISVPNSVYSNFTTLNTQTVYVSQGNHTIRFYITDFGTIGGVSLRITSLNTYYGIPGTGGAGYPNFSRTDYPRGYNANDGPLGPLVDQGGALWGGMGGYINSTLKGGQGGNGGPAGQNGSAGNSASTSGYVGISQPVIRPGQPGGRGGYSIDGYSYTGNIGGGGVIAGSTIN